MVCDEGRKRKDRVHVFYMSVVVVSRVSDSNIASEESVKRNFF